MTTNARRQAAKANHPSTWTVTRTDNGPGVQGSKARAGSIHIRATDGVRVLNADVMPDEAKSFDPESHWALVIGQSPKLRFHGGSQ
jgi:hypothetical protein